MVEGSPGGLILGIESSCDETAAAVVRDGRETLANVVASQMTLHANYGGVVPELASREHLRNIVPVVREAMYEAGVGFADLDAIAVTEGPGLAGALLVGITYAKALAAGLGKPLIAVNHLEGHIHAVVMEASGRDLALEMPLLALVVSGGHTHLYLAEVGDSPEEPTSQNRDVGHPLTWRYRNVGRTVDDAAGEAFDKVAKLLGLGYPGGPWMDALAGMGNPQAVEFRFGEIKRRPTSQNRDAGHPPKEDKGEDRRRFPSGMTSKGKGNDRDGGASSFDFSFSGIKTAVLRYVEGHGMRERVAARRAALGEMLRAEPGLKAGDAVRMRPGLFEAETLDLIASFQFAVVGVLMRQTFAAAEAFGARGIVVSGGVAANSELRRRFAEEGARRGLGVAFPSVGMSTDNAAMIAAAAWPKFLAREFAGEGLVAAPGLRLGKGRE
jgi:N6-L-threonylcarbamoyladenine synthase